MLISIRRGGCAPLPVEVSPVKIPRHPSLVRQMIEARIQKLVARHPVLAASLVQIARRCGRPGCHCESGERHVGYYLTRPVRGKTRTVYVPRDLVREVRTWIQEHKRLKQLVREITDLSLARVRGHVQERKRRRGRS